MFLVICSRYSSFHHRLKTLFLEEIIKRTKQVETRKVQISKEDVAPVRNQAD